MSISRLVVAAGLLAAVLPGADTLRIMTMNVRYPAEGDGPNVWEKRRDLMVETIRKYRPDVIGTQELFQHQGDYLVAQLPEYVWFGLSRRGDHTDEHMGVFFLRDRFELTGSGNYWLSETPEKPGSSSWNMSLPRMVTWGEFRDRLSQRRFRFVNTHFPHRKEDEGARTKCAELIAARLKELPENTTVILTGDFNTGIDSETHRILTGVLVDAWKAVKRPEGPVGTFHGFTGKPGEARIDWILFRGPLEPASVETITMSRDGRYPSDHFPVLAAFNWR
jgi:endonuclease/exonuclease/phosphatase family metal-dependent hydrolase